MFKKDTYIKRREQLRKDIGHGLIIIQGNHEAPCNYTDNTYWFRQDSTFLYFFGLQREDLVGVLDCDNGKDYIFANDYDIDDIIWTGPLPSVKELAASVGVDNSGDLKALQTLCTKTIGEARKIHYLPPYRADNTRQMSVLLGIKYDAVSRYSSMDLIKACVKQRSIKSSEEIEEIEKAIATAYNMHVGAMKMAMPGRYEYELAGFMQGEAWKGNGPVSFPVIMTIHGETLHNHGHNNKLVEGRMLVMDAGCETAMNYCSDITRSVPIGGHFNERQKAIYEIVLNANLEAIRVTRPGITYQEVHTAASRILAQGYKDLGILKGNIDDIVANGAHSLLMPHGLGHMMGWASMSTTWRTTVRYMWATTTRPDLANSLDWAACAAAAVCNRALSSPTNQDATSSQLSSTNGVMKAPTRISSTSTSWRNGKTLAASASRTMSW